MLQQVIQFVTAPRYQFAQQTLTTLKLSAVPILVAIVLGIGVGIIVAQRPIGAFIAANLSGLARAIPTLAFLAIAEPFLGIGFTPSVVALTALGIPPILLNTIAGLRGIDPATIDAGRGMGMTSMQVLTRIQIPLVLPVVAAGVRTSAVQIVATVPLAALIGGGGYGDYITLGLSGEAHQTELILGALAIALLALLVELLMAAAQRAVTPPGLRADMTAPPMDADDTGADTPVHAPVAVS
ncbi:MAG: ABC transporter permease [Ktedonobacterales bacterium]